MQVGRCNHIPLISKGFTLLPIPSSPSPSLSPSKTYYIFAYIVPPAYHRLLKRHYSPATLRMELGTHVNAHFNISGSPLSTSCHGSSTWSWIGICAFELILWSFWLSQQLSQVNLFNLGTNHEIFLKSFSYLLSIPPVKYARTGNDHLKEEKKGMYTGLRTASITKKRKLWCCKE